MGRGGCAPPSPEKGSMLGGLCEGGFWKGCRGQIGSSKVVLGFWELVDTSYCSRSALSRAEV
jgi:hypothetical protein